MFSLDFRLFYCLVLGSFLLPFSRAQERPVINIDSGVYTGLTVGNGQVDQYLGIRYGEVKRFKPPIAFKGPVKVDAILAKACPQFGVRNSLAPETGKN